MTKTQAKTKYPRYKSYKGSGIEWLGEIPKGWSVYRLGMVGDFSASGIDKKEVEGQEKIKMVNYTDIYGNASRELRNHERYMITTAPNDKTKDHILKEGDILFTPSSETVDEIGESAVVMEDMPNTVYSYHAIRYRPKIDFDTSFEKYLCNNNFALHQFSSRARGTTRMTLNHWDFKDTRVIVPPKEMQERIAGFLDEKTEKIDALMRKNERLIELLKERRQALISHAVTKGLDENTKMKDSGVEWLGEIPRGWNVKPFKALFDPSDERVENDKTVETPLSVSGYRGIEKRDIETGEGQMPADDISGYRIVRKGQLAVNTMWLNYSGLGVSQLEGYVSPAYRAYDISKVVDKKYAHYLLRSNTYVQKYTSLLYGIRPNSLQVKPYDFERIEILLPPIQEQEKIAEHLDVETKKMDSAVNKIQRQNELLKEYRQSLISSAVTGKIRI